jgi:zinc transport system substrate-binding protein
MIVITGESGSVRLLSTISLVLLLSVTGCGAGRAGHDGRLPVVAAFYPLQFLAERIGGDRVTVTNLIKPGAEPHDLELRPRQVAQLADAKLVLQLAGFQPALDEAVTAEAKKHTLDVAGVTPLQPAPSGAGTSEGNEETTRNLGLDPHVWLDPVRFAAIGDAVADRLVRIDPDNAPGYRSRAAVLHADLAALDADFAHGLATCARHEIVTSHGAFGYLAARYRLAQIPISGLSPEEEPTPQHIAAVADLARRDGVTTIFFETLVSPKIAATLAREIGARAEVLDPIEGLEASSTDDYLSVMRANLGKLRQALGCS